jgi:hypothetical protein
MATITPNYSWPVPTSTDLVKDGATAIEALGDAIDATVFALPGAGLVKINTTSFSAVSSQSFNDVFSTTYDNYLIKGYFTFTNANTPLVRFRVSGSDNSTSNYTHQNWGAENTTTYTSRSTGATSIPIVGSTGALTHYMETTFFNPFASLNTGYNHSINVAGTTAIYNNYGHFNATTSFTGFSIIVGTGTMSGAISVLGINK